MNPGKFLNRVCVPFKRVAVVALGVCSFPVLADLYVSENGVDTNPGTSAAPFRSVQAAVDAAPDEGCTIHVAAGTYYAKAGVAAPNPVLSVKKPVQILGAGAGVTFISGADLGRYCAQVDCEGALLKDVTLCHAKYSAWVTGVGLKLKAGEVRNVIIEDMHGYHSPGAEVSGGALYDSVIRRISTGTTPENIGLRLSGGLVSGCEIYGLSKVGNGSMTGAGVRQTGGTLENCYIHDNWYGDITYASHQSGGFANSSGVGLWMSAGLATGCRIARNGCIGHAAGAKVTGTAVLENSVIVDNVSSNVFVASEGGGVSVDGTKAVVRGCVIANNRAFRGAGGLALLNGTVTNNIIYANGISNCFFKAGTFADNVFVNPGIAETVTYTRPSADAFSCSFTTDRDFIRGNAGGAVAFTASAKNAPGEVTYAWSFSDGGSASGASVSHSFGVGRHTVTLTATSGDQTAVCLTKNAIVVYPQKVYVSKTGTPKFPYTSTDDAASEIDDVMDLFPLEIEVGAGTYGLRNKGLFFGHAVRVTGAGPDVTIVDGKNTSYTRGLVLDDPAASVSGLQFYRNNLCTWDSGAGIQLFSGTVSNCWVRKAKAYNNIGVNLWGGRLIDSRVFECENGSSQMGLAVSLRGGSMYGCVVSNNTTTGTMNGIVYMNNAASVVSNCTICCNQAGNATTGSSKGGAVSMTAGLVTNSRLLNNKSGVTGGGAYLTGGTLRNCLIEGNSTLLTAGSNGGGIYNDGGVVENCTVVGNTATGSGDGLYQNKGSTVNSIVWQNTADNLVAAGGTVTYSCMSPVVAGDGNTATAPAFVSAATGNWRLTSLATAQIDHGTPLGWMTAGAVDLEGNARVVRDVPDMGCYEYAPSADEPFIAQFTATGASGKAPINASFEAVVSKHPASECTFSWYFGDSETPVVVVGSPTTSHLYETAGSYTVRLVVSHGTGGAAESTSFETPACVNVIPKTCYVSTIGGNVFPYDTLAKAARDVLAAYAVNSDEIVVSNGIYESATISLGRSVMVRSLNGLGTVTLSPSTAAQGSPFVNVSAEGAVLSGIAVSGGYTAGYGESLGGSGVHMTAGLVTNCIVRGCRQYACGGVFVSGTGHFIDCVVSNNDSWANGGYAGGLYQRDADTLVAGCRIVGNYCSCVDANTDGGAGAVIAGGTMRDCVFTRNIGNRQNSKGALTVTGGLVSHCVITNNELYSYAGGVWQKGGTVRNCLIADNVTVGARDNDGAGGLLLDAGTAESLTIVANRSERPGGGVRQNGGTLLNSVVYGNTSPAPECDMIGGTRTNCLSATAMVGADCLGGDPLFENAAAGDYRLSVLSPAKGAGLNQTWMTDAVDLANFMRISGDRVDIGAYEADATAVLPLSIAFAASASVRLSDGTTRITFMPTVGGAKGAITLTWDFGDGSAETEAPAGAVDHVYQPGAYTVKVKASDAGSGETTEWVVRTDYAVALPKVCYVATGAGVTPRYPYVTPETGAATLNDALVAGTEEICVMPGTYQLNETLNIGRAVKVYSQSGKADDVVVTGKTADNFLMVSMNDPAAELRGITLSGGYMHNMDADLGATVKLYSGLIVDCILENGHTYCNGAVSMNGGTIRRSVIRGHRNISSGVCNGLQINAGLVDGCIITNNSHIGTLGSTITPAAVYVNGANARIRNSLIAYNKGYYGAGLLLGNSAAGEVVNCTIVSNVATYANGGVKGGSLAPLVCANNIVWGNVAPVNPEMADDIVTFFSYSCSPALTRGSHNISADPLFRNVSRGDWRLKAASPCVESGDWSLLGASKEAVRMQTDIRGMVRLRGSQVDMGCYEKPNDDFMMFVR